MARIIEPFTINVGNSPTPLFSGRFSVHYLNIMVRDMGDATYVAVGRGSNLTDENTARLVAKQASIEFSAPPGMTIDVSGLAVKSDFAVNKPVIEITGVME